MTTFDINVILTRLSKIEDYLKRLEKYQFTTLDEYSENQDIQLITERLIQVMTEAALDIIKVPITKYNTRICLNTKFI